MPNNYFAEYFGFSFANSNLLSVTGTDITDDIDYLLGQSDDYMDIILNETTKNVGTTNYRDFIMSLGLNCRSMITCYDFTSETDCCDDAEDSMGIFGKCFRFKPKVQYVGGVGYGHFFKIRPIRRGYNPSNFPINGVIVRLVSGENDVEYQGRFVGAGTRTQIGLRRTSGTFLSTKHYECQEYPAGKMSRNGCIYNCLFNASFHSFYGCHKYLCATLACIIANLTD